MAATAVLAIDGSHGIVLFKFFFDFVQNFVVAVNLLDNGLAALADVAHFREVFDIFSIQYLQRVIFDEIVSDNLTRQKNISYFLFDRVFVFGCKCHSVFNFNWLDDIITYKNHATIYISIYL